MTLHEWRFEWNHGYVAHLDNVFTQGNAPRLAGMLHSLANPVRDGVELTPGYLDIPKLAFFAPDDGEYRSTEVSGSHQIDADMYSILQGSARKDPRPDLQVEQFFYHADILSGQKIGKVRDHPGTKLDKIELTDGGLPERVVEALDTARAGTSSSIWDDLDTNFNEGSALWSSWNDAGGKQAKAKFRNVHKWFSHDDSGTFRQNALRQMSAILIQYAATIHAARISLDNLMGELVDQALAWNNQPVKDAASAARLKPGDLAALAKPAFNVAFAFIDTVIGAAHKRSEEGLKGPQLYDMLGKFLHDAERIVKDTVEEVDALMRELDRVREGRSVEGVGIPVWDD